ncbi:MAG: glycosyl transferase, partial [Acetatifactor sp.]|nr:glycosyl transferase [Acetatifactor sp.]
AGMRVIRKMMQLYKNYKPLKCFGLIAALFVVAAVILFAPILLEYLETGLVPRFPTLIVCGFLVMAAIQAFFSGMVLDVQVAKDHRDFEYRLNKIFSEKQMKCTMETHR